MRALKMSMRRYIDAQHARDWVRRFIEHHKIDVDATIFYTYWLTSITEGLVLASQTGRSAPRFVVSRAHGSDLYEDRSILSCLPGRENALSGLAALFLISEFGRAYVSKLYPARTKYLVSRLGVPDSGGFCRPSDDNVCRIVSCSFLRALKRIDLLFDALLNLAKRCPERVFEWTHIGEGQLSHVIRRRVASEAPNNLVCRLMGHLDNEQVIATYLSEPIDVFINVSSSEGIPVSIMEAQSCGIPVVATAVGGSSEIVSNRVGTLLPSNPTPQIIASAIIDLTAEYKRGIDKRTASYENWRENYNAPTNYGQFAKALRSIVRGRNVNESESEGSSIMIQPY
jgi:colanic acid/amylovoran biosynthesis glycosyltransferase